MEAFSHLPQGNADDGPTNTSRNVCEANCQFSPKLINSVAHVYTTFVGQVLKNNTVFVYIYIYTQCPKSRKHDFLGFLLEATCLRFCL